MMAAFSIGIISDTHGLLRREALEALRGSDLIIHAGDIGSVQVLESLREIAPVRAVRGNTDNGEWARILPKFQIVEAGQILLYVVHDLNDLDLDPMAAGVSAVISGHSHMPSIQSRKDVLFLNPGSAGPKRFMLPIGVACIKVNDRTLEPRLIDLTSGIGGRE
jgi:uncharacterized protein